jgi:hypothetical protein
MAVFWKNSSNGRGENIHAFRDALVKVQKGFTTRPVSFEVAFFD